MINNECRICIRQLDQHDVGDVQSFLELGLAYLAEIDDTPEEVNKIFLRSIVSKDFENDRWLLLLLKGDLHLGFVHAKIDIQERPGWGYILEFYIVPKMRRKGYGSMLHSKIVDIFVQKELKNVWLTANPKSESFWRSVGFSYSGEEENGYKVMCCEV